MPARRRRHAVLVAAAIAMIIWLPALGPVHASPRRTEPPEDIAAQQPDGGASDPPITPAPSTFYLERPCTVPELTGPDMLIEAITDGCEMFSPEAVELFALDLPDWQDPGPIDGPTDELPVAPIVTLISGSGLSWPVTGPLTSLFGAAHPLGIDIALNTGTPIAAAGDGRVAVSGYDAGYGNFVLINHAGGYATVYGHFMVPSDLQPGDAVRRGQIIGLAGSTGQSTGPHLHFEVRLYGRVVNPLGVLPSIPLVIDPLAYRAPDAEPATPTPTPTPAASPTPTPAATPAPTAKATPAPSDADPTASPAPAISATPTGTPPARTLTAAATPAPTVTATRTPVPSATPTPTPTPTPSPAPARTPTPTPTPSPDPDALRAAPALDGNGVPAGNPPLDR